MAGMRILTELTKGSEFSWMTDTYIWQDDAACAFSPPSMFEVALEGDPIAEGLSADEIKDLNSANIEAAKKVCNSCPVWHLCYQSAKPVDFHETVRAGVTPLRHVIGKEVPLNFGMAPAHSRYNPNMNNDAPDKGPCSRGHEMWGTRKNGDTFCRQCKRDADNRRSEKKKEGI